MQARSYRPDIGRFLSQDRYEAASADVALQSDPLTQNRYAFAAGNPINNIEFDGHGPCGNRLCPIGNDQERNEVARRELEHQRASSGAQPSDRVQSADGTTRKRTYAQQRAALNQQAVRIQAVDKLDAQGAPRDACSPGSVPAQGSPTPSSTR
ncbi:MAG: RHS repeat-associated core domain-containing protein [Solirubrobacteraceae bacterium]